LPIHVNIVQRGVNTASSCCSFCGNVAEISPRKKFVLMVVLGLIRYYKGCSRVLFDLFGNGEIESLMRIQTWLLVLPMKISSHLFKGRTRVAMQNTIAKIPSDVVGIGFMHTLQAEVYAKHVGDSASTYWVVNGDNLQN
ncbi:hypothetical protein Tco_0543767, partial [Tanacetum coccineum]